MPPKTTPIDLRSAFAAGVWLLALLSPTLALDEPPRDTKLVEKKAEELPDMDVSGAGKTALSIDPKKWKHAETDNFIIHFRRVTEAKKVAREIEYTIWYVAKTLGAKQEDYSKKSHVFVFEDAEEWKQFLSQVPDAQPWFSSFALGDELFLNVRAKPGTRQFDSKTLNHECAHAVVARLYPRKRWPLWLNEGFAEYMGSASVADRKNQTVGRHQGNLDYAEMSIGQMEKLQQYPSESLAVAQLYQSGEKFVRFLMTELPPESFPAFVDATLSGSTIKEAVMTVYEDKVSDWEKFEKAYANFSK